MLKAFDQNVIKKDFHNEEYDGVSKLKPV